MTVLLFSAGLALCGFSTSAPAQNCATSGGNVNVANTTCTVPSGTALNGGTTPLRASNATIDVNGAVTVVPNGNGGVTAVSAVNAGVINFVPDSATHLGTTITFTSSSGGNMGLAANGTGSRINAFGLTFTATNSGGGITAAQATNGGTIVFDQNSVITINGGGGNLGLIATGAGSSIQASDTTISIAGTGNDTGATAQNGASITLTDTVINNTGSAGGDKGIWTTGAGSQVTANNVTIDIPSSGNGMGILTDTGTSVALSGTTTISVGGGSAYGLQANGASSVTASGPVDIGVSGSNGAAALLQNGSTVSLTGGGNVMTTGTGSFGFLVQGQPISTLVLDGVGVDTASDAFEVRNGGSADVTLDNSRVTSGSGVVLRTTGGSTTTFDAGGSQLTGAILTDAGSTGNVTLHDGTTWTMTANSTTTNLANNDSVIDFTAPSGGVYKTLTTVNYMGSAGTVDLNTYLAGDDSPSDRIVINGGNASGSTILRITNTGGPGAETSANGILVVSAIGNGTTDPGSFSMPDELRAGAFDYALFRGGVAGGDSTQDWFLRSHFVVPPGGGGEPPPPVGPVEPPTVTLPPVSPPAVLPPGNYPIIGPELATYGVVQPLARQMGVATLGTLHDRIGDTLAAPLNLCAAAADPDRTSVPGNRAAPPECGSDGGNPWLWGRFFGQSIDDRYRAFADPSTSGQILGFQAGADLWHGALIAGHRDVAGLYVAYANADVDVEGLVTNNTYTGYALERTGSVNLDAWSGGAYWTHYGPGGWYIDAVAQLTRYEASASTPFASLDPTGTGVIGSLEGGYPIALPLFGPGFTLEPQAQIIWQRVEFDDDGDRFGSVALGTTDGATGRIGIRAQWTIVSDDQWVWQPYLRANLWQDWGGKAKAAYAGADLVPLLERASRVELGGGLTVKADRNFSFYANADYEFAVGATDGGKRDGVRGAAGIRYIW